MKMDIELIEWDMLIGKKVKIGPSFFSAAKEGDYDNDNDNYNNYNRICIGPCVQTLKNYSSKMKCRKN